MTRCGVWFVVNDLAADRVQPARVRGRHHRRPYQEAVAAMFDHRDVVASIPRAALQDPAADAIYVCAARRSFTPKWLTFRRIE